MSKLNHLLATLAATGLVIAGPALAQTRAAGSLPAASVQIDPAPLARSSTPLTDADELGGGASPVIIIAFLALIVLVVIGVSGGGSDSPG